MVANDRELRLYIRDELYLERCTNVTMDKKFSFHSHSPGQFLRTIIIRNYDSLSSIYHLRYVIAYHYISFLSKENSHASSHAYTQLSETSDLHHPPSFFYIQSKKKNLPFETLSREHERELKFKTNLPSAFPPFHLLKKRKNNESILIIRCKDSPSPQKKGEAERKERSEEFRTGAQSLR